MANIVITSTTNTIKFAHGTYSTSTGIVSELIRKDKIAYIREDTLDLHLGVLGGREIELSHNGASNSFIVDSVDGVAPASLADLYTKISALIA